MSTSATLGFLDDGDQVDILIVDGDIDTNLHAMGDVDAVRVHERTSIAQDIKHMILESGFLTALIAERHWEKRKLYQSQIRQLVDEDLRIVPGTVAITESGIDKNSKQTLWLTAKTEDYQDIGFYL